MQLEDIKAVLSSIPSQAAVLDAAGTIVQVNEAWSAFAREKGGSDSLVRGVGISYLEICRGAAGPWADEAPVAHDGILAVLSGERAKFELEYPCHSPTEKRWFLMTVLPFKVTLGWAVVSHVDITQRKLAEIRHAGFDRIVERSLNEIYIFDADSFRFIEVNESACRNLGYTLDELQSMTPVDIKPEHTEETFAALVGPLLNNGKDKIVFTTVHLRKDGSEYPVEVHLQRMMFDDRQVYAAIILDITTRTQTEEALAQARLFLESAPDATIIVNGSGKIEVANSQTTSLFGYTQKELRGMPVEALVPERFRDGHPAHREQFAANPKVRGMGAELDLYAVTKTGREIPIEVSLSSIQTGDGPLVAAAVRDISKRKQTEEALRLAKSRAERATRTKSRFLAAASHDLRQPLQSLSMYLSVMARQLERPLDQPKLREVNGKMLSSLETMSELLDALLDISKLDGGSIIPEKRDIRIQELLNRIVTDNMQQAKEKGLQLNYTGDTCVVHSDPGLLERVLENFVTNAIRYTEHGCVTIDCQLGADVLRIAVSDTGIGIAQDDLETIFEEYYQLDNPVRDRSKGLGLGLAIVKHIALLLDHPLDVVSVPGEGSTFAVDVPLGTQEEARAESRAPAQSLAHDDRKLIVLIVDDDFAIVDATMMLLELAGMQAHGASNGDDALAHIEAGICPDIVVSDYRLPGYNGVEVIKRVRQATVDDLPTVLVTGDTSAREIEAANLSNCSILHKPVDTNRLISLIEKLTAERLTRV
ncbi:MAG: PAS domain-containing hybrid sensor histidine kinase/response regulator [Pseudomonadales bacterium]